MQITFKDRKLQDIVNNDRKMQKEFGKIRAVKLKHRLDQLYAAVTLEDLKYVPGNYHELTSDRKGQWACDLDQPYRLVFTPHEQPVPVNASGQYLWIEIKGVEILEIVDYH